MNHDIRKMKEKLEHLDARREGVERLLAINWNDEAYDALVKSKDELAEAAKGMLAYQESSHDAHHFHYNHHRMVAEELIEKADILLIDDLGGEND